MSHSNEIRQCLVPKDLSDDKQFPRVSVSYHDKQVEAIHSTPYGVYSNPPAGLSFGILFNIEGHEENRVAMVNTPQIRFKNLEAGEVVFGNPLTESNVKFDKDGNVIVTGKNNLTVTVDKDANVAIGGNCNINVAGVAVIQGSAVTVVGESITLTDSAESNDEDALVTYSGMKAYVDAHKHSGVMAGGDESGVPTVALPSSVATTVTKAK
jgi:phage gp45-like